MRVARGRAAAQRGLEVAAGCARAAELSAARTALKGSAGSFGTQGTQEGQWSQGDVGV